MTMSDFDLPAEYITASNDLRSDTFTTPTAEMVQAAMKSSIGDSVYKEDVDTVRLEQTVSQLAGKEAGLFCVSGTLSNQVALRTHLMQPPYSILCDYRAHVYTCESAGLAILSQAMVIPVMPCNGSYLTVEDIASRFIPDDGDIHCAPTRVVSLEQTLNGIVTPYDELVRISSWCRENGLLLHCDGARIWNACVATGLALDRYCELFDSMSICLSKSIGAPMGSILVGSKDFIKKANHFKKQQGGGIRQAGMMSRMALVALNGDWKSRIQYSHDIASDFAQFCIDNGVPLQSSPDSSFIFLDLQKAKMDPKILVENGIKYGVKLMGARIAFHYQISQETLRSVKLAVIDTFNYAKDHPYIATFSNKIYNDTSAEKVNRIDSKLNGKTTST